MTVWKIEILAIFQYILLSDALKYYNAGLYLNKDSKYTQGDDFIYIFVSL